MIGIIYVSDNKFRTCLKVYYRARDYSCDYYRECLGGVVSYLMREARGRKKKI